MVKLMVKAKLLFSHALKNLENSGYDNRCTN